MQKKNVFCKYFFKQWREKGLLDIYFCQRKTKCCTLSSLKAHQLDVFMDHYCEEVVIKFFLSMWDKTWIERGQLLPPTVRLKPVMSCKGK